MATTSDTAHRTVIRTSWGFMINSILTAALAVVFTRTIEQFGVAVAGWIADRDPILTNVVTLFEDDGTDLVLIGGPIASLFAGLCFLVLYPGAKDRSVGKLMVLWMVVFSFRNGFLDLALAMTSDTATATLLERYDVTEGLDVIIVVAGVLGLLLIAVAAAPAFLGFSRHRSEVDTPAERARYVFSIAIVPAVVGPLLAVPFFIPDQGSGYASSLPLYGAFLLVTLLVAPGTKNFLAPTIAEERVLSIAFVVTVAVVFIVWRFILEPGIPIPPWNEDLTFRFRP